ncbi:MAG: FKBP-type peptidyl-prolyl cis-trans isomerase [Mediterranea sp.]|jgi:FKBP-type peptidyl-prolyl cis-trans isomerase FklB|nr:FKBP-type peptidyl-prolyl cis-trans isomerase [Mediterranea sp.]
MRKTNQLYAALLLLLTVALGACGETEEVSRYDNWRTRSDAFMDSIAKVYQDQQSGELNVTDEKDRLYAFQDQTNGKTIYVKKIESGSGTVSPYFTSTVNAYYRMSYFNGDVVQQNFSGDAPTGVGDAPATFTISSLITGWQYTLIYMKVGDFWTIYIPYESGYADGTGGDGTLQPYSALVYNVKLDAITELTRGE